MSKFRDIAAGTSARRTLSLPLLSGGTVAVAIVPLLLGADTDCLAGAREYAKAKGIEDPKPGDPLYERGLMIHVVLKSVVDADVTDRNDPFFGSIEELERFLDSDRLAFLFASQRRYQNEVAPAPRTNDIATYTQFVMALALSGEGGSSIPLGYLPLKTEQDFTVRLAKSFFGLLKLSSPSTLEELASSLDLKSGLLKPDGIPSEDGQKPDPPPPPQTQNGKPRRSVAKPRQKHKLRSKK